MRASRYEQVLAYLERIHAAGRPGAEGREICKRVGVPWAVLDRLLETRRVRINHCGVCLPAYAEWPLPEGVARFRPRPRLTVRA